MYESVVIGDFLKKKTKKIVKTYIRAFTAFITLKNIKTAD